MIELRHEREEYQSSGVDFGSGGDHRADQHTSARSCSRMMSDMTHDRKSVSLLLLLLTSRLVLPLEFGLTMLLMKQGGLVHPLVGFVLSRAEKGWRRWNRIARDVLIVTLEDVKHGWCEQERTPNPAGSLLSIRIDKRNAYLMSGLNTTRFLS